MDKQRGNILFLILLAVALFAALGLAVTNSVRGGGKNGSSEKLDLYASQIVNEVTNWRNVINRLELVGGYRQVRFNTSAANDSGTCYTGSTPTSSCRTIGLFNAATGVALPLVRSAYFTSAWAGNANKWAWSTLRIQAGGLDVGTAAPETIVAINGLTDDLCRKVNERVNNSSTVGTLSISSDSSGRAYETTDGVTFSGIGTDSVMIVGDWNEGCMNTSGINITQFILDEN